jgi:hypothetical protein
VRRTRAAAVNKKNVVVQTNCARVVQKAKKTSITNANPRIGENQKYEKIPKSSVPTIAPQISHEYARNGEIRRK